ncbi:hypothetical protein L208DRAFT_1310729, partial [Tricholoma matsutake]
NIADAVWDTLSAFGIQEKAIAFMADNALNMDTFVDETILCAEKMKIIINPVWAWLWCMPHTIHLAALKLLEAIGAKWSSNDKKTHSPWVNYQDSVSASLSEEVDNDAATQGGEDEVDLASEEPQATVKFILPTIDKKIHSSPQQKARWLELVSDELCKKNPNAPSYPLALMLILDVSTHWSSTHQMMHKSTFCLWKLISSNPIPYRLCIEIRG